MTPEEKAKEFDASLERAKKLIETCDSTAVIGWCEYIFPMLKEPMTEDERIRKEILAFIRREGQHIDKYKWHKWIAWLEKQGEPTEINPSEFDLRLNKLLQQFETLPKEELANSLSFYLNVVQNDGTYKPEKQDEQEHSAPNGLKFGVGDIVKSKSQPMLKPMEIKSIGEDCYYCEGGNLIGFAWEDDYEIVEKKELSQSQVTEKSEQEQFHLFDEEKMAIDIAIKALNHTIVDESDRGLAADLLTKLKQRLNDFII